MNSIGIQLRISDFLFAVKKRWKLTDACFFDISVMAGDAPFQPLAPVEVRVEPLPEPEAAEMNALFAAAEAPGDEAPGAREPEAEAPEAAEEDAEEDAEDPAEADHTVITSDPAASAVHFFETEDREMGVAMTSAREAGEVVTFKADGFSVWGVLYTVDFYYGNYEYHLPGEGHIALSGLFELLKIEESAAEATEVSFSSPELLAVRRVEEDTLLSQVMAELGVEAKPDDGESDDEIGESGDEAGESAGDQPEQDPVIQAPDWLLVSLAPFTTHEKLTVTMESGAVYEISVEDAQYTCYAITNGYNNADLDPGRVGGVEKYQQTAVIGEINSETHERAAYVGTQVNVTENQGFGFRFWLKDDGTAPNAYSSGNHALRGGDASYKNIVDRDTTYIAFFAPTGEYIVRVNWAEPNDWGNYTSSSPFFMYPRSVRATDSNNAEFLYYFTSDVTSIHAENRENHVFLGWYHNYDAAAGTGELISRSQTFEFSKVKNELKRDLNLTPVYEPDVAHRDYYDVWLDGGNGVYGGVYGNGEGNRNTLFTRIESTGNVQGAGEVCQQIPKTQTFTLPTAKEAEALIGNPQSSSRNTSANTANHYEVKSWYEIYSGEYYAPGATVPLTGDSVFYADWFPVDYNIGQSSGAIATTDTGSFITTRMFDYTTLFNMPSLTLDDTDHGQRRRQKGEVRLLYG